MATTIYYDGECPFCSQYVTLARLRASAGPVTLVNLREDQQARSTFVDQGYDLDKGMIVETSGGVFHGAEAMHVISAMSSGVGILNRAAAAIFGNKVLSSVLYPFLRAGRNSTLFLLGRNSLGKPDEAENALFELFARVFGLFMLLHVFYYWFRGAPDSFEVTSIPLLIFGLGLVIKPEMRTVFVASIITLAIDGWRHAPVFSNHTILLNFLILAFLVGGVWHLLRGSSWVRFFADVRPVGQVLLLIMYTFGIFHKINSDFIDPLSSCAVVLWREMPPPFVWVDTAPMHYLAIYGTFAVEGAIMMMLLLPRWRHWGICAGMGFHSMLALSGFAMYPVFTTLAITLHIMFVSPEAALRITSSAPLRRLDSFLRRPSGVAFLIVAMGLIVTFASREDYRMVAFVWLMVAAWPLAIIATQGSGTSIAEKREPQLWSRLVLLNLIPLLFFINCASPYLGFKTAQSMNMFANLRVEGNGSNHLLITNTFNAQSYTEDVVFLTDARGSEALERASKANNIGHVYYQFLNRLENEPPEAEVAFTRGGEVFSLTPVSEILARDGEMLHSAWIRKFLHFLPVKSETPQSC